MTLRIRLDPTLCDGNGLCVGEAPDYFELDADYVLHFKEIGRDEDEARLALAVQACPKAALALTRD